MHSLVRAPKPLAMSRMNRRGSMFPWPRNIVLNPPPSSPNLLFLASKNQSTDSHNPPTSRRNLAKKPIFGGFILLKTYFSLAFIEKFRKLGSQRIYNFCLILRYFWRRKNWPKNGQAHWWNLWPKFLTTCAKILTFLE